MSDGGRVGDFKITDNMKTTITILILIPFLILIGCVPGTKYRTSSDQEALYDPWVEIGYCLDPSTGEVSNIVTGGWMSCPMPLCPIGDIVIHTHPVWAEKFANILDLIGWEIYHEKYGNDLFGIQISETEYIVYEIFK